MLEGSCGIFGTHLCTCSETWQQRS